MPNQAMELTETRRTTSFSMASTLSPAPELAPGLGSSSCSRQMYPRFGQFYGIFGLIIQVVLLAFSLWSYRVQRTRGRLLLLFAVICFVLAASSWFTFPFMAGLLLGSNLSPHAKLILADSRYYSEQTFQILFALFMIAAFLSLVRGVFTRGTENI